jgi:hypothetical protein
MLWFQTDINVATSWLVLICRLMLKQKCLHDLIKIFLGLHFETEIFQGHAVSQLAEVQILCYKSVSLDL